MPSPSATERPPRSEAPDRRDPDAPTAEQSPSSASSVQTPAVGTRLSAAEIHDNVVVAADEEMSRPAAELALSAFQAGLMIGFSLLAAAYLASLVGPEHRAAASAAGYPLGFIFVVLARSQLFTENTLDPLLPLLERRDQQTLKGVARLWAIVLPGNLLGALAFALLAAHTPMIDEPLRASLHSVAEHATGGGFGIVFYRAIFGGWLVALMAWLVASTSFTGAQILFVWLTTAPIAAFGFRHSIAGAAEAFYQAASGEATWGAMVGAFLVPAILGNIVGGGVLVALLNHAQVLSRLSRRMRRRRGEGAVTA